MVTTIPIGFSSAFDWGGTFDDLSVDFFDTADFFDWLLSAWRRADLLMEADKGPVTLLMKRSREGGLASRDGGLAILTLLADGRLAAGFPRPLPLVPRRLNFGLVQRRALSAVLNF